VNDARHTELTIVELRDDELDKVSGSDKANGNLFQILSNCLRQMADVQKAIIANIRA